MKKQIHSAISCLCFLVILFGLAGCGKATSDVSNIGGETTQSTEPQAQTFTDGEGNVYTYFDENSDYHWDGFTDAEGNRYYFFDEDNDGTPDGYLDAEGNRIYYDATKNTGEEAPIISHSTTASTQGGSQTSGTTVAPPVVQTKPSAELYKDVKGTTVTIMTVAEPTAIQQKHFKAFELAYGCKVQTKIVAWNDFKNQFLAMVTASNVPDTCQVPDETFLKWISRGLLQPLDAYVNATDEIWSDTIWEQYSWKGKHYGTASSDGAAMYCIYNASLFKAKGVKTPLEYYNEGKWNFTNFKKTCIAMTYGDVVGCGISWRYLLNLCNGNTAVNVDNAAGKVTNALNEQSSINAVETVVELRRGKYITFESGFDLFANSKMAMYLERPWNTIGQFDLRNTTLKNATIEICPLPKGPDAKEEYCVTIPSAYAVPTNAKNPLGACAWFYFEGQYGEKHKNDADVIADRRLTYTDEQWEFCKQYEASHKRISTFVYGVGNWYQDDWGYWASMINDGLSVQAANDKFAGEFQAMIDTLSNT